MGVVCRACDMRGGRKQAASAFDSPLQPDILRQRLPKLLAPVLDLGQQLFEHAMKCAQFDSTERMA